MEDVDPRGHRAGNLALAAARVMPTSTIAVPYWFAMAFLFARIGARVKIIRPSGAQ